MVEFTGVFFDMDGVTVDTAAGWKECEETHILPNAVREQPNSNPIRAMSVRDAYDRLVSTDTMTVIVERDEFESLYEDCATEVYRRATLMSGYRAMLDQLRERGRTLGLVSASPRQWAEIVLDRFELEDAFDVVVTASDIDGPSKPDPYTYERAAALAGISPEQAIAIEDSPHGIAAATAAGMRCIAYSGLANRELDLSEADQIVETPDELRDVLLHMC